MRTVRSILSLSTLVVSSAAFSTSPAAIIAPSSLSTRASPLSLSAVRNNDESRIGRALTTAAVSLAILTSPLHNTPTSNIANADEWGKETEAPTLFTGETVMICKKRGPLGACLEQTVRTTSNDNDKALKYFKDPSEKVKQRQQQSLQTLTEDSEGNALIQKLRKQSADNKEKNDLTVLQKTLLNDQSASFGPFSKQVVILNTDGRTFSLLQNPQAMRLKKAGYIEDRKFVIQPSQEVIDEALVGEEGLGNPFKGLFGGDEGSDGGEAVKEVVEETAVSDNVVEETAVSDNVATEEIAAVGDTDANVESAGEVASDSS